MLHLPKQIIKTKAKKQIQEISSQKRNHSPTQDHIFKIVVSVKK